MLKYTTHDIVFQEFPDEVSLAINLSCCPNGCPGCHSAYLQGDIGEELTQERLLALVASYADEITCVGFMGGDADPESVMALARLLRSAYGERLKTGWYSGRTALPKCFDAAALNYVKLGPYVSALGPLSAPTTNQRLYRIDGASADLVDITHRFQKRGL